MDTAATWLEANDPDPRAAQLYADLRTHGNYRTPRQELPWGNTTDLEQAIAQGATITDALDTNPQHICRTCLATFEPRKNDQRTCSDTCRRSLRRDYQRDLMRQRRAIAA